MAEQSELEVLVPEYFREPKEVDTYRFRIDSGKFGIDFGKADSGRITLVASLDLTPETLLEFLKRMLWAMQRYESENHFKFGVFPDEVASSGEKAVRGKPKGGA